MSDLCEALRRQMMDAGTYAEFDSVERAAFHSYVFGSLSHREYSGIYALGSALISANGWH